jgi:hypothetical protein
MVALFSAIVAVEGVICDSVEWRSGVLVEVREELGVYAKAKDATRNAGERAK